MQRLKLFFRFLGLYLEYTGRDPWDVDGNKALYQRCLAARNACWPSMAERDARLQNDKG